MLKLLYSVLNLIAVNTNTQERSLYIGVSGMVWGAGCILGPVIGGSFADSSATWRWVRCSIFFCNDVLTKHRLSTSTWYFLGFSAPYCSSS